MRYRMIFHCYFNMWSRMRSCSRHLIENFRLYYRNSKNPCYEYMKITFSHRLYIQILELNNIMKRKRLGWRLTSHKGCNFISKVVRFEGKRMNSWFCMNFYTISIAHSIDTHNTQTGEIWTYPLKSNFWPWWRHQNEK